MSIFNSDPTRKMPKALLLTLLMIIIIELSAVYFDNELYEDLRNGVFAKIKSELATSPRNTFDVLFMGDCYNQTGIDPRVFDRVTAFSSFNFSTDAGHTVMSSAMMLNNYLRSALKKPKYIFFGFLPMVWTETKETVVRDRLFVFYDQKAGNIPTLIEEFGALKTARLFIPSLKHQDFLRKTSLPELMWRVHRMKQIDQEIVGNVSKYRGVFLPIEWENKVNVPAAPDNESCGSDLTVSPFFKKYMEAMLNACQKHGVKPFYIIPAAPPAWAEHARHCHHNESIQGYLKSLTAIYPDMTIIDPQEALNTDAWYYNEVHLNTRGAEHFSVYLGEMIKRLEGRL